MNVMDKFCDPRCGPYCPDLKSTGQRFLVVQQGVGVVVEDRLANDFHGWQHVGVGIVFDQCAFTQRIGVSAVIAVFFEFGVLGSDSAGTFGGHFFEHGDLDDDEFQVVISPGVAVEGSAGDGAADFVGFGLDFFDEFGRGEFVWNAKECDCTLVGADSVPNGALLSFHGVFISGTGWKAAQGFRGVDLSEFSGGVAIPLHGWCCICSEGRCVA